jgi:ribose 5-phosphate isomerase A
MSQPPTSTEADESKQRVGRHAAALVADGMSVGLGTGSTVHWTIVALGERRPAVRCVATSSGTEALARSVGLDVRPPDEVARLDVAIDGADEVDPVGNLVKGGGGAHTREKLVAEMADQFVVVVDGTKLVPELGAFGVPVEVLDFAPGVVAARLLGLGAVAVDPVAGRSDNGNLLFRARFGPIADPGDLARALAAVPGLVEHGLFLADTVDTVLVATADGRVEERTVGRGRPDPTRSGYVGRRARPS